MIRLARYLRSRRLQLTLAAAALLSVPLLIAFRAYRDERRCFVPTSHPPRLGLSEFAIPGLREVSFPSRTSGVLRGFFAAPPERGAAVVLVHGSNGERSDLVAEARLLARAGFGVLAFDWPGHGQSQGHIDWGQNERAALAGALDWLSVQPGVDASRLGAFGFSMGGYIVTQVASQDTRLKAVAIASTPHDPLDHLRWEYRRFGVLRQWPALLALRVSGMNTEELVPEAVIGRISPRPLLLIGGREDQLVPGWMSERLLRAAGEPKRLLLVPNAGHGDYAKADPVGYEQELLGFFEALRRD